MRACDTMATLRFFVLEAISVRVVALGGLLSENTLAIGIGEDVQRIYDVECLTHLWRAALGAGHGFASACGWVVAGHTLVRPCVVTSMGDIVTNERLCATRSESKTKKRDATGAPEARCVGRWRQAELGRHFPPFRFVRRHRCHGQTLTALGKGRVDVG